MLCYVTCMQMVMNFPLSQKYMYVCSRPTKIGITLHNFNDAISASVGPILSLPSREPLHACIYFVRTARNIHVKTLEIP